MKYIKIMMAVAAFGLATGSVQARLGWNMSDCELAWGKPFRVEYQAEVGLPAYIFKAQSGLFTRVFFLNGEVNSISYISSKSFLNNNLNQLLGKNCSGDWTAYDDGRGKYTSKTWQVLNPEDGSVIAYALFFSKPDNHGLYYLQVSSGLWDAFVNNKGVSQTVNQAALNI